MKCIVAFMSYSHSMYSYCIIKIVGSIIFVVSIFLICYFNGAISAKTTHVWSTKVTIIFTVRYHCFLNIELLCNCYVVNIYFFKRANKKKNRKTVLYKRQFDAVDKGCKATLRRHFKIRRNIQKSKRIWIPYRVPWESLGRAPISSRA